MHGLGSLHYAELMLQKIGVLGVRKNLPLKISVYVPSVVYMRLEVPCLTVEFQDFYV